ncbi:bifunctional oligoribonuclease/PAP phosphatase NrnA [Ammoniphilus sp. YIM 78166]|uniref:DHH family phosphoesterase n=1 Tax=Ammoniphilus sp. YIM 78166 TaxID=1644106 RepID=UPI0010700486|nr:bifunctional oligoribonuclease/PAP phosphatase NrnA [Ammoniphilus sp. YIM 78166]
MSYKLDLAAAGRFLADNDHFLVVNHVNPDGDATGSLLAVGHMLKSLGKNFTLANEGPTPEKFKFIPLSEAIIDLSEQKLDRTFDRVIALDCGDFQRIGAVADYFSEGFKLLNIDHHPTNDSFGSANLVRTDACATAEILYDLMKDMQISLHKDLATSIYMGLLTDTGGFRYSNTTAEVLHKAADLLNYEVSPGEVAERCLETITVSYLRLLREVLPTLTMDFNNRAAYLTITLEAMEASQANREDMEGIVNYARNIEGVEVGVLFKQVDSDIVKVSMRSNRTVDVAAIAKELGGGGHAKASGCTVKGSLTEVTEVVREKLKQAWGNEQ